MSGHEQRDDLLRRIALGELQVDAPEVRAASEADPELAAQLAAQEELVGTLDALRAEREAAELAAAELDEIPGRERVSEIVRSLARSETPGHSAPRSVAGFRFPWRVALTAAAVVAVLLFWSRERGTVEPPLTMGPKIELESPAGVVDDYGTFAWTVEEGVFGSGDEFVVEVYDEDGNEVVDPVRSTTTRWTPPSTEGWPDKIRWRVILRYADGSEDVVSEYARAQRS